MHLSERIRLGIACVLAAGCAEPIDRQGGELTGQAEASAPPPPTCLPFRDTGAAWLSGGGRSVVLADGSALWLFDAASNGAAIIPNVGASLPAGRKANDCFASVGLVGGASPVPLLAPSPLGADLLEGLLAPVTALGATWLFYSLARPSPMEAFGVHPLGIGVAKLDPASSTFVPSSELLWTADRPAYGSAVLVSGGFVYVYGCTNSGLSADCFVARAALDAIDQIGAYSYYQGSADWSPHVDDAFPITSAGNSLSVVPAGSRFLLVYVAPLGSALTVRSGLAPEGPWSAPFGLGGCELPAGDVFCTGADVHLELEPDLAPGTLAVSYGMSSFSTDFVARALAAPDLYWPRLARVTVPSVLP